MAERLIAAALKTVELQGAGEDPFSAQIRKGCASSNHAIHIPFCILCVRFMLELYRVVYLCRCRFEKFYFVDYQNIYAVLACWGVYECAIIVNLLYDLVMVSFGDL